MNKIKELRKSSKLTQKELAQYLKISDSTLSYWERGDYEPDNNSLIALASFFDVSIDYLLGRSESSSQKTKTRPVYDDEAWEMMREMYERPELRALFKTSKKVSPEDIKAVDELLKHMAGENDDDY